MAAYLDHNSTTPLEPAVREVMLHYFDEEYGNAASRTHAFGLNAKKAVQRARAQVAAVVDADPGEVVFTSGATEANNLALLGLALFAEREGRKHFVTTTIEHKAVSEPLEELEQRGFEVTRVPVGPLGRVDPSAIVAAVRKDTAGISVMAANNETGVLQPIAEIADALQTSEAYFHVDAAQSFGKVLEPLRHRRIDLISVSAHKMFGPKGIGALIMRSRAGQRPPLTPLTYGGGHERGLRPGTLPTPLIAALGAAAELAVQNGDVRRAVALERRAAAMDAFQALGLVPIGDQAHVLPHVLMAAFPGVDSEALMLSIKDLAAVSNGSACTSAAYAPSHVLQAMGLETEIVDGAVRFSWSHLGDAPPWQEIAQRVAELIGD